MKGSLTGRRSESVMDPVAKLQTGNPIAGVAEETQAAIEGNLAEGNDNPELGH
jgi:hypothetical protein